MFEALQKHNDAGKLMVLFFLPFPEAAGVSEQAHRPTDGENQAATRQTREAESAPASTAEQGELHPNNESPTSPCPMIQREKQTC